MIEFVEMPEDIESVAQALDVYAAGHDQTLPPEVMLAVKTAFLSGAAVMLAMLGDVPVFEVDSRIERAEDELDALYDELAGDANED